MLFSIGKESVLPVLVASTDDQFRTVVEQLADNLEACSFQMLSYEQLQHCRPLPNSVVVIHAADGMLERADLPKTIKSLSNRTPQTPIIVVLDGFDGHLMMECLAAGARDCLYRPLDLRRLSYLIDSLTIARLLAPKSQPATICNGWDILTHYASPVMKPVMTSAVAVARHNSFVLLTGETGVGKTFLARFVHENSQRKKSPFVDINCGAIPQELLESELFGHKKGAFTGADANREGRFTAAGCGTIFLDEVDSLPLPTQAKLLRALDEKKFEPVGSNKTEMLQARVITASHGSLRQAVDAGRFRADLFFRLQGVQLHIPTLRERTSELRHWANLFAHTCAQEIGKPAIEIGESAWFVLADYHWPGNLRELRNIITQAVSLCAGDTVEMSDLPRHLFASRDLPQPAPAAISMAGAKTISLQSARAQGESCLLSAVLTECGNNRSQAAKKLGISRAALYKRLHQLSLG